MTRWEVRFAAVRLAMEKGYSLANLPALIEMVDQIETIVCGARDEAEGETPAAEIDAATETPDAETGAGEQDSGNPAKSPKKAAK